MKTKGKDDSRTATSSNRGAVLERDRNDDKKNDDIRRACLLYNIKDMML